MLQLALAPIAIQGSAAVLGSALDGVGMPYAWMDFARRVVVTVLPAFLGFLIGYGTRPFPAMMREPGRWLFTIPAALYIALVMLTFTVDLHPFYLALFGVRGTDYEGLGVIGLIFPVAGYCLYSVGVRAGDRYTDPLKMVYGEDHLGSDLP